MSGFTGKSGKAKGSGGGKGSKGKGASNDGQAGKVRGGMLETSFEIAHC